MKWFTYGSEDRREACARTERTADKPGDATRFCTNDLIEGAFTFALEDVTRRAREMMPDNPAPLLARLRGR